MRIVNGNILNINSGVILHQVNCQGVMGAGVAKALRASYPRIYDEYMRAIHEHGKRGVFGSVQYVQVSPELIVANSFSQFRYGNSKHTGEVYTDVNKLIGAIRHTVKNYPNVPVYIPYGIGAGFGGADWNDIASRLADIDVIAVKLPDRH